MKGSMRSRKKIRSTTIYSPATFSPWGRRVHWLRAEFQMSYRDMAKLSGLHHMTLRKMTVNPLYEPFWRDGQDFLRWYKQRMRDVKMRHQPAAKPK